MLGPLAAGGPGVRNLFDLTGKVALVTGGGRGLGEAISLGLAGAGADLVIASRKLEACEAAARRVEALGRQALAVACHMGRWKEIEALVERAVERFGRIDVLVNNAATNPAPMALQQVTEEFFDKLYSVNVKGPLRLAALVAERMARTGGGSIINVLTMGAYRGGPYVGIYTSGKAALLNLTQVMAREWAEQGVRVNALAPGPFMTDMLKGGDKNLPGFIATSAKSTIQKRVAEPEEIVGSVLYLASAASSFVTGETLNVSGGM
jgi:NAD(P)-dependent dehydrogenase (short-subunit alcohol dehydrogenase family)